MKRALPIVLSLLFITTFSYSQGSSYGINAGTLPFGKVSIKAKETGVIQKGQYGVTNPTIHVGYSFGDLSFSQLMEFTYSKNILMKNDSLGDAFSNYYGGHIYMQEFLMPNNRIQFILNLGGGLSKYTEPNSLLLDLGVKGRLMFFINHYFALYGGGYYMHSVFSKKFSESNYGVEAGLVVYFQEMFTPKYTASNMKFKKADETLYVSVFNDWGTPLSGAKVTLVSGNNKTQDAPTVQGNTFVFKKLRPGPYTISIERDGFNKLTANLTVYNTSDKNGPSSNNAYYNMESNSVPPFKNVYQAINDATMERTEGDITYYLARCKKTAGSTYDQIRFDGDLSQMMDNVHYKLVKQIDKSGFLFRNLTEEKIKKAKNNNNLKLPKLLDIKGACDFYTKNLEGNSDLANAYKSHIAKALNGYLIWQKEIKWFCDGSPYPGDLLKGFKILPIMENKRDDYVYCITADSGYIVNGELTYAGGLLNRKMNGKGRLVKGTGWTREGNVPENFYEGTFKDGKMNGTIYHKMVRDNYHALNGTYVHTDRKVTIEERGNMVNDQWNGEVDYTANGLVGMFYNDHAKIHYVNGVVYQKDILDDGLSRALLKNKYTNEAEDAARKRAAASVTENEIMNYVKSIETEKYGGNDYYYVVFIDGDSMKGTVLHYSWGDWAWDTGHQVDGLFSNFRKVRPNTKNRALLELYWYLHDIR